MGLNLHLQGKTGLCHVVKLMLLAVKIIFTIFFLSSDMQITNVESIRKMHIFSCGVHQKNAHFPVTFGHQLWLCPMGVHF